MTTRVHNFCAGPCTLPTSVLEEVRDELTDFHGLGMSIIEDSHRAPAYEAIHQEALSTFRTLANVPNDFAVLFLQGGATLQFAQVPLNLLTEGEVAGYINTGAWAKKALVDADLVTNPYEAWTGANSGFDRVPVDVEEIAVRAGTRYIHLTSNETIDGVQFRDFPELEVPLVADMSSDLLSLVIDWERFDLVYGGAQKNLGPSGLTIVVVRQGRLGTHGRSLPSYLDYATHHAAESMVNTPPMFAIYVMGKVLAWMALSGGLVEFERRAKEKANLLYNAIDNSDGWYRAPVSEVSRSRMNVVFRLPSEDLEDQFVVEAAKAGMVNLKGHRSVGGIRASIYNAMPIESVEALVEFMKTFMANTART